MPPGTPGGAVWKRGIRRSARPGAAGRPERRLADPIPAPLVRPKGRGRRDPALVRRFDRAALMGAAKLRFAPARRHGLSIATAFLQPIEFRHPQAVGGAGALSKGEPDTTRPRPAPVPPPAAPVRPARSDTTPAKRDTVPRPLDTARAVPDSAAKRDTNAVPH